MRRRRSFRRRSWRTERPCRGPAASRAAVACSGRSSPWNFTSRGVPALRSSRITTSMRRSDSSSRTSSRQPRGKPMCCGMVFGTGDDARLVVGRQAHRLRLVELGILKCSQPDQAIAQTGRQRVLGDIDLIAENQLEAFGQRPGERRFCSAARGRRGPGRGGVFVRRAQAARRQRVPASRLRRRFARRWLDRSCGCSTGTPIGRHEADAGRRERRYCQAPAVASASGRAIRLPKPPWGSVSWLGKKRS